jgi:dTDP-4-dehydrorhamnose reductase
MFFDGHPHDRPGWEESDTPHPTNYYSWTKAWSDAALLPFLEESNSLILRIHTPISDTPHPRNFLQRLCTFPKAVDEPCSLTSLPDLWSAVEILLAKEAFGLFHATNSDTISPFELATLLHKAGLKLDAPLSFTRENLDQEVAAKGGAKQTFPILSNKKLAAVGVTMPSILEAAERDIAALRQAIS